MAEDKITIEEAVRIAYFKGYRQGFRDGKGKPSKTNRCPHMMGRTGYQCVLARGHSCDHQLPPTLPHFTPHRALS